MSYRNNDIAACEGNDCPMRTTCLRWQLGQTMDEYQWWAKFEIYAPSHCEYYIHNTTNNDDDNERETND